ncbi:MAG: hypothetical protein IJK94_05520 [Bacteroidaceae bacterium]|nr:hypothetical protein [Bacteroidaceae bacterium]
MKKLIFAFVLFVMCMGLCFKAEADNIPVDLGEMVVDSLGNDGDGTLHGRHRGPILGVTIPTVYYNTTDEELSFETIEEVSFSYYIKDEDDYTVLSGQLALLENGSANVSLSSLLSGSYTLIIELNGIYYIGYFAKEDD